MHSIFFPNQSSDDEALLAELWEAETAGVIDEDGGLRAFFENAEQLSRILPSLGERCGSEHLAVRQETPAAKEPWFSREEWEPVLIGKRFIAAPSWLPVSSTGRFRLTVDTVLTFGTGRHESTQLAIETLEDRIRGGETVLDIGCGSGILSEAAILLGAATVFGCDLDPRAAEEWEKRLPGKAIVGSADAFRTASADIVVANLTTAILNEIEPDLRRIVKPGGKLILSGFLMSNPPARFTAESIREKDEWACWTCTAT